MAKIAAADLTAEGFKPEQFGQAAGGFDAYLDAVIADVAVEVADAVGATIYALDDSTTQGLHVKKAELYLAMAVLWKRRAAFMDGNINVAGKEANARYLQAREYRKQAKEDRAMGLDYIASAKAGGSVSLQRGGPATGVVETGPYPEVGS